MMRLALHWQILMGMIFGAAVGLMLNVNPNTGQRERLVISSDGVLPEEIESLRTSDSPNQITIEVLTKKGESRSFLVDGSRPTKDALATLGQLKEKDAQAHDLFRRHGRSTSRRVGDTAQTLGGLFLRLLRMVAMPLIVSSLAAGVMGLGSSGRLGRMFGGTLLYYVCTSLLAIVTGLLMVNLIRPGLDANVPGDARPAKQVSGDLGQVLYQQLEMLIPANPIAALADTNYLSVISFTLAFSVFATMVGGKSLDLLRSLADAAMEVMMAMTMAIIRLAPLGVLFLMMYVTATQGPAVFSSLFYYMLAVVSALAIHALIVLPLILRFVARRNPLAYARAMSPALLTAFSSASSNGTLPLTLTCAENRAGVSNRVSSFVLPLGATINMDGTALYEAVAVLFIAQLHHGVNLELSQQIIVAVTALLASIGAAGIPHAGLVMMVIILKTVNLPLDMQGIILAVDRVLDMCRTSVNVWSDACGCAVVSRFQPELEEKPAA